MRLGNCEAQEAEKGRKNAGTDKKEKNERKKKNDRKRNRKEDKK